MSATVRCGDTHLASVDEDLLADDLVTLAEGAPDETVVVTDAV